MNTGLPAPPRVDIRAIREQFGLTQADVADEVNVNKRTIRRWELGEASPSPMALANLRHLRRRLEREREQQGQDGGGGVGRASSEAPGRQAQAQGPDAGLMPRRRLPSL